jgi:hypothetical protein
MDLIDRYLDTVRLFLPRDQRDDIAEELRDLLMTRREERQAELGHALTPNEDEALLRAFGHPLLVAARYGRPQYLVGPELYPIYAFALKIVLAAVGMAALITGLVNAAVGPDSGFHAVGAALDVAWTGAFAAIGAVTLVFAVLQRSDAGRRIVTDWRVRDLPHITLRRRRTGWSEHVAGIIAQTLFILWWIGVIRLWPTVLPLKAGGALQFAFAPALQILYLPMLALSAGTIAVHVLRLSGREARPVACGIDMVVQVAVMAVMAYALRAGHWVVVTGTGRGADAAARLDRSVNIGVEVTLIVIVCAAALYLANDVWRLARPELNGGRAASGA